MLRQLLLRAKAPSAPVDDTPTPNNKNFMRKCVSHIGPRPSQQALRLARMNLSGFMPVTGSADVWMHGLFPCGATVTPDAAAHFHSAHHGLDEMGCPTSPLISGGTYRLVGSRTVAPLVGNCCAHIRRRFPVHVSSGVTPECQPAVLWIQLHDTPTPTDVRENIHHTPERASTDHHADGALRSPSQSPHRVHQPLQQCRSGRTRGFVM